MDDDAPRVIAEERGVPRPARRWWREATPPPPAEPLVDHGSRRGEDQRLRDLERLAEEHSILKQARRLVANGQK